MSESNNHVVITLSSGGITQIAANHHVKVTVIDTDVQERTDKLFSGEPAEVAVFDLTPDDDTVQAILVDLVDDPEE